eukprot:scaffold2640_cov180-Amphora_coffeaeformis.AAC.11
MVVYSSPALLLYGSIVTGNPFRCNARQYMVACFFVCVTINVTVPLGLLRALVTNSKATRRSKVGMTRAMILATRSGKYSVLYKMTRQGGLHSYTLLSSKDSLPTVAVVVAAVVVVDAVGCQGKYSCTSSTTDNADIGHNGNGSIGTHTAADQEQYQVEEPHTLFIYEFWLGGSPLGKKEDCARMKALLDPTCSNAVDKIARSTSNRCNSVGDYA